MSTEKQLIAESIDSNLQAFVDGITFDELYDLVLYLNSEFIKKEPTTVQARFVDEFFGLREWMIFVEVMKRDKVPLFFRPPFDLDEIRHPLSYKLVQQIPKLQKETKRLEIKVAEAKLFKQTLKVDLLEAVNDSYYDGSFDKIDGFCNISDVLLKHKLVKYKED